MSNCVLSSIFGLEIPLRLYMMRLSYRFHPTLFANGQGSKSECDLGSAVEDLPQPSRAVTPDRHLVVVTVYIFISRLWVAPPAITSFGHEIDHQYDLTLIVTGTVFILSQLGLAYAIFRFRDRGQRAHYTHGNNTMEVIWTSATIILFVGLGLMGYKAWAEMRFAQAAPNAIQVEVTENQFVFNFRYPGPDGKFGKLDPKLISASTGNPLGLDPNDPAGKDDIVVPTLTVPVDHEVELLLRSQDVIHNFFVRELRLQQDTVPGHRHSDALHREQNRALRSGLHAIVRPGTLPDAHLPRRRFRIRLSEFLEATRAAGGRPVKPIPNLGFLLRAVGATGGHE